MRTFNRIFTASNVIAVAALFFAIAGSAFAVNQAAKNSVTSKSIKDGTVQGKDVHDASIAGADLAANSVDGSKVTDDSLTGADIGESQLGRVPEAAQGGIGRSVYSGSCDPQAGTFTPCSSGQIPLPASGRLLVIGTARAKRATNDYAVGSCRVATAGGSLAGSQTYVSTNSNDDLPNLTVMGVTDVLSPGNYEYRVECDETGGNIEFVNARVSAVSLSGV
jgi:hypothetical protein